MVKNRTLPGFASMILILILRYCYSITPNLPVAEPSSISLQGGFIFKTMNII
jgi:hypothetical protein